MVSTVSEKEVLKSPVAISISRLSKSFNNEQFVLEDVNLTIGSGEFFILLGPSGCGKSTLLSMIAGFVEKTSGELLVNHEEIKKPDRNRGVVFQQADAALFPWLTIKENVEFGLKMKKMIKQTRNEISSHYIKLVGLDGHEGKYPRELSGGMKQRVQLARVLANDSEFLLMDEPFGALDAMTRRTMQIELIRIWKETNKTIIFVTHDIQEALLLGQRIGVMSKGPSSKIEKIYDIPLSYPRTFTDKEFNYYYQMIQSHFD
ncbi:nitrate ABC transporter ATP-binding protein [Bacillus cereus]|uniref:ABC transporter ATP-binding protein n=1 Tax=Bacillus cereus group TaxID=86661 RepID=UPI000BEC69D0|nr:MULTISPECIES: ABC transporter ATP-binding protein [Bacillus cereus group]MED0935834.1 ABC transporter ATP-binding protein [Bacillus mobilis]MED0952436.1 ABC transporter ATP-binding protein [Bacillus mobilis]MED0997973.1 ABC transporter ATP-binding protein [Bacillus mobilis]MED1004140.1 ABC transporter ATP-binding protein [Bacillus mobilis]PDZ02310.1 nitrate ABC transporter ATP-binding protein [Bacillus cereus]